MNTTKPRILDFECPRCNAPAGNNCMADTTDAAGNSARFPTNPHSARRNLWIEAKR